MRIRSAHACKGGSENEHMGRGGEGAVYAEPAPRSASGCHAAGTTCTTCTAGSSGSGSGGGLDGHGCGGNGGGGTNDNRGLRAVKRIVKRVGGPGIQPMSMAHECIGRDGSGAGRLCGQTFDTGSYLESAATITARCAAAV